jgi:hypothetical protein
MKPFATPEEMADIRRGKEARRAINKRVKAARPKIQRAPEQRQPRVRDRVYLAWIRRLPCVACLSATIATPLLNRHGVEAAHVRCGYPQDGWRPTGMQERPDDTRTVPLCAPHHRLGPRAQHATSERLWWEALGIHPPEFCAALRSAFENSRDGALVVKLFASRAVTAKSEAAMSKTSEEIA